MRERVYGIGLFLIAVVVVLTGCEKEITVDLPEVEPRIVVEGFIEQGQPPIVFLTWSQGYFDPVDLSSLSEYYISGATVNVSNGTSTVELDEICTSELPEEILDVVAEMLGFSPEDLLAFDICAYTSLNEEIWGETGKEYTLTVDYNDEHLHSTTKINELVYIDSLWFDVISPDPTDSLGFIFGVLTDPDTAGNAYRWFAKRISHYPMWENNLTQGIYEPDLGGQQEDGNYIAPLGSVFDDEFFNGLSFEFGYYRDAVLNSNKRDDNDIERGYFKIGDTVAVRGCVIDRGIFNFLSELEEQQGSQGSPFAVPFNLSTNVEGGLGAWIGYGAVYDTVICQ
ncbi:MAG: DUF4249 family protein [Flavobacteriales bacterium]|nr:DUF4249 family protein [Flavobacteriales bacterium]